MGVRIEFKSSELDPDVITLTFLEQVSGARSEYVLDLPELRQLADLANAAVLLQSKGFIVARG